MKHFYAALLVLVFTCVSVGDTTLHQQAKPFRTGMLQVSDIHTIYWEASGNIKGTPVFILHGGPGGTINRRMKRYFDPEKYLIIQYDQRGCGKSTPNGELAENTTADQIEDINRLREQLRIRGKMVLCGVSWGSMLAVLYAEKHPGNVSALALYGLCLARKQDFDYRYQGALAEYFPNAYKQFRDAMPNPSRPDYIDQVTDVYLHGDDEQRKKVMYAISFWHVRLLSTKASDEELHAALAKHFEGPIGKAMPISLHYLYNRFFIEENQIVRDAWRIKSIPTYIINGRYDFLCRPGAAYDLAAHLDNVRYDFPPIDHTFFGEVESPAILKSIEWLESAMAGSAGTPN